MEAVLQCSLIDFEMSERGGREGNIAHFKIKVSAHPDFEMSERGGREGNITHFKIKVSAH